MSGPAAGSKSISGFDPRSIGGCQLWLDGADSNATGTSTNGAIITTWKDKSINGYSGTSVNSPTLVTASQNGLPCVSFTAASQQYFNFGTGIPLLSSGITVFAVGKTTFAATGQSIVAKSRANGYNGRWALIYESPNIEFFVDVTVGGNGVALSSATKYSGVFSLFEGAWSSPTTYLYVNGNQTGLANNAGTPLSTTDALLVGAYPNASGTVPPLSNFYYNGTIGEILVYNCILTSTQRQSVEGYLAWKWGIQASISSFSPSYISGCVLWLDAEDLTTMFTNISGTTPVTAAAQSVSLWKDKSGNGYNALALNAVGLTATAPTYQTSTGPAVYFLNSTDMMIFSNFFTGTSGYDIFVVGQPLSTVQTSAFRTLFRGSNADHPIIIQNTTTNIGFYRNSDSTFNQFGSLTWTNSTTQLLYVSISSTNTYQAALNGTSSLTTATVAGANNNFLYLGNYQGGAQPWGYVNELIILSNVTPTQRALIETYLSRKWGLTVSTTVTNAHPYNYIRPFTRQFSPIDLPGCALWLDAADASTINGTTTVTAWNDKSGNANNTTTIGGSPSYSANFISLNGSSTYLVGPYVNNTQTMTMFVIATANFSLGSYGYYYRLLSVGSTAANDYNNVAYASILHNPNTTQIGGYRNSVSNFGSVTTNTVFLIALVYDGTNTINYINGTSVSTAASTGTFSTSSYSIGRDVGNTDGGGAYTYWPGTVGEVLLYNISLTTAQRQAVEGYLAQKWKVTLTSHPFTNFPPSSPTIFSPTNFIGCQLWMDASQETSANNATISTIPDRSGNGITLTAIGSIINYQNYRNGNSVYYFGNSRASNASFPWGTSFTHIVVASSVGGAWLNSVGTLTSYVGLGNWALANINSSTSFEDPGSANSSANWTLTNGATVSVSNLVLSLSLTTTSGSRGQSTYGVVINSARETSFSFNFPSSGTNVTFGWTNGTTPITFLITTIGTTPTGITCPSGAGTVAITGSSGATVLVRIYNTSYYIIAYSSASSSVTGSWTSSGGTYTIFFATSAASTAATTFNNVQFDPGQGASVLPKTTGLAGAWHIAIVGYTAGSTSLTNYSINGSPRPSWISTAYSGITPLLPLYINGNNNNQYDTSYYAEIIHYNVALSTTQRQAIEGYLSAKWSIPLPITHPYYKYSPSQLSQTSLVANVSISLSATSLTATWSYNPDVTSYTLNIFQNISSTIYGAISSVYATITGLTSNTYTYTGLIAGYFYRASVTAIGPGGSSQSSASSSLIYINQPSAPTLSISMSSSGAVTSTISWTLPTGAQNTTWYIGTSTTFGTGNLTSGSVIGSATSASTNYSFLTTTGPYYAFIVCSNASSGTASSASSASSGQYSLAPATLTMSVTENATVAGGTTLGALTFTWTSSSSLVTPTYTIQQLTPINTTLTSATSPLTYNVSWTAGTSYSFYISAGIGNSTATGKTAGAILFPYSASAYTFTPVSGYTTTFTIIGAAGGKGAGAYGVLQTYGIRASGILYSLTTLSIALGGMGGNSTAGAAPPITTILGFTTSGGKGGTGFNVNAGGGGGATVVGSSNSSVNAVLIIGGGGGNGDSGTGVTGRGSQGGYGGGSQYRTTTWSSGNTNTLLTFNSASYLWGASSPVRDTLTNNGTSSTAVYYNGNGTLAGGQGATNSGNGAGGAGASFNGASGSGGGTATQFGAGGNGGGGNYACGGGGGGFYAGGAGAQAANDPGWGGQYFASGGGGGSTYSTGLLFNANVTTSSVGYAASAWAWATWQQN